MFRQASNPRCQELLADLGPCPESHAFLAAPVGISGAFVGRDDKGRPTLFLPTIDRRLPRCMGTNLLSLSLGTDCALHIPGETKAIDRFDVLQCQTTDGTADETFALLADAIVSRLDSEQLPPEALTTLFLGFARMFQAKPDSDMTNARQGLWGELFLMHHLGGAKRWIKFWHSDPFRRWDFSIGTRHIEVKTSVHGVHAHTFAHQQLFAPPSEEIAIASLLLRVEADGLSLRRLIVSAREEVGGELDELLKLEAAVRIAGMTDPSVEGPAFETDSLEWYWAADAPKFIQHEPLGVSNTHYRVDLGDTVPIPRLQTDEWISNW